MVLCPENTKKKCPAQRRWAAHVSVDATEEVQRAGEGNAVKRVFSEVWRLA